ncbi:M28 family peptidase [Rhodobacteraceae bacterium CCMM004]|nr:M28 family peptidase [Rhodobacteraceae bacterium CCMM004]
MDTVTADLRKAISMDAPWALVEAFASQEREKPEDADRGAQLIAQALERHGVPVTMHRPTLWLSMPIDASVTAGGVTFRAKPPAFCASVPEGVEGALVYLPQASGGTPLDRNPAASGALDDVKGKIAVIEGFALPNFVAGLEAAGAAGVIAVNPGEMIHWGTVSTIWGTPTPDDIARFPRIPSAAVNRPDGEALIALAKEGGRATIATELETGWYPQYVPVVDIPGTDGTDDFVLLHGHYDSWREGVGDNGTGNACMLEIARVLWENRDHLRRGVRLAWWAGHSTGRYGGSAWFADAFALDLADNCVAHMNCDSPGCRWATDYSNISCMSETLPLVQEVVSEVTGQTAKRKRPQRNSDYTFNNIGISACFMASSMMTDEKRAEVGYYVVGGCGGNIAWHTEADTFEIADRDVLETDINLYLEAVLRFANDEIVPVDWRRTAAEFAETVDGYAQAAGDRFDLAPASEAVAALSAALSRFHDAAESKALPPAAINGVNKALARILVPLNYTRGPRFTHDPALNVPPLPTIAEAAQLDGIGDDHMGFALTQLLRGRNRLVAALREATRVVEAAL